MGGIFFQLKFEIEIKIVVEKKIFNFAFLYNDKKFPH